MVQYIFDFARLGNAEYSVFASLLKQKFKKILRKSQLKFWRKLRKLRLKQNSIFLVQKTCNANI